MGRIVFAAVIIGGLVLSPVCFGYSGGSGTPGDPYQIATKEDLLTLAGTTVDYNKCFILTADIDVEGQVFTTAIIAADTSSSSGFQGTTFTGTFDGDGYTIKNFTINGGSNYYLGLFGYLGTSTYSNGLVENLGLENFAVSGSSVYYVGGIAGYSSSNTTITNCYSTGSVSGSYEVGNLVGRNNSSISNCYSTGSVNGTSKVGGFVGWNYSSGSITNCYSTGAVNGSSYVGGLVGYNYNIVSNSFWDVNTSGRTTSAGGTGLTTAQMMQQASFTGWDFVTIWAICEGTNYPRLTWQILVADWVCPDGVETNDLAVLCEEWLLEEIPADVWPEGGDGIVDFFDWAVFANQWQTTVDFESLADFTGQWLKTGVIYCITDIAPDGGDGIVNMLDFAILAQHWLE